MKAPILFLLVNVLPGANPSNAQSLGYLIGALLSIAIFGYLIYSLIKPEKF
jgi:K+-transporting ATPase KdpF subunit